MRCMLVASGKACMRWRADNGSWADRASFEIGLHQQNCKRLLQLRVPSSIYAKLMAEGIRREYKLL